VGYDVHITRRTDWFEQGQPSIALAEWLTFVQADSEMRLDGFAEANLGDGSVLRTEDPSLAVWFAHPERGNRNGLAWLWLSGGNVQAKNPDVHTLKKMWTIAQALGAKVQGDDGELYESTGQTIPGQSQPDASVPKGKPWWRLW